MDVKMCIRDRTKIPPEECSCIFLPYLYASNTNPFSRCAFFNINAFHTKEHFIRCVYEGIVFCTLYHLEKLNRQKDDFRMVRMSGGMTNSVPWTQMMCDALQMPVEVVNGKEQGAKGAAMCAAVACGAVSYTHLDVYKRQL